MTVRNATDRNTRDMTVRNPLSPARLSVGDLVRVGGAGLRARTGRVVLSALGIAIGIAAMLGVVGISASSQADLDRALDRLGTNLLTVGPGQTAYGDAARLPAGSVAMVGRIGPVQRVSAVGRLPGTHVYRNDHIPSGETGSIQVLAAGDGLPAAVAAQLARGAWLNAATARYPGVVLGAAAAARLDVRTPGTRVWLGGQWFGVTGILLPVPLAGDLDAAALVGWPAATTYLHFDGHPTRLYVRSAKASVEQVRAVLAATANPSAPAEVLVSRPSDVNFRRWSLLPRPDDRRHEDSHLSERL